MSDRIIQYVERRLERVAALLSERIFAVARYSRLTASSPSGQNDQIEGMKVEAEQPVGEDVRRMGSGGWGLAGVPPAGEPVLVVNVGGGSVQGIIAACGSKRYAPADMADGDVALFCKHAGVTVYLKAEDGSITITDAAGQQLKLDGLHTVTLGAAGSTVNIGTAAAPVLLLGQSIDSMGVPVAATAPCLTKAG